MLSVNSTSATTSRVASLAPLPAPVAAQYYQPPSGLTSPQPSQQQPNAPIGVPQQGLVPPPPPAHTAGLAAHYTPSQGQASHVPNSTANGAMPNPQQHTNLPSTAAAQAQALGHERTSLPKAPPPVHIHPTPSIGLPGAISSPSASGQPQPQPQPGLVSQQGGMLAPGVIASGNGAGTGAVTGSAKPPSLRPSHPGTTSHPANAPLPPSAFQTIGTSLKNSAMVSQLSEVEHQDVPEGVSVEKFIPFRMADLQERLYTMFPQAFPLPEVKRDFAQFCK